MAHDWVSYRQDRADPQRIIKHFGALVHDGPIQPPPERPQRTTRNIRLGDLDAFFHPWCAPAAPLPKELIENLGKILAEALVADYRKTIERWAKVPQFAAPLPNGPKRQAKIMSFQGRRIFTMTRGEWARLRDAEGKLVEIDLAWKIHER